MNYSFLLISLLASTLAGALVGALFLHFTIIKLKAGGARGIALQAATVMASAIDVNSLAQQLKDGNMMDAVRPQIEGHIDNFLRLKLKEKIPALAMFMSDSLLDTVKKGLLEEIELLLPEVLSKYAGKLLGNLDVQGMIARKLAQTPDEKIGGWMDAGIRPYKSKITGAAAIIGFCSGLLALLTHILLSQ